MSTKPRAVPNPSYNNLVFTGQIASACPECVTHYFAETDADYEVCGGMVCCAFRQGTGTY